MKIKLKDCYVEGFYKEIDMETGKGKELYYFDPIAAGACNDEVGSGHFPAKGRWLEKEYLVFKKDGIYKEYYTRGVGSWFTFKERYLPKEWGKEIKLLLKRRGN
jgi:hypothetical protein